MVLETQKARDNESWWDLKEKGGDGEEKKNCPIHGEGGQTAAVSYRPPSRNLQILKSPRFPHGHM